MFIVISEILNSLNGMFYLPINNIAFFFLKEEVQPSILIDPIYSISIDYICSF